MKNGNDQKDNPYLQMTGLLYRAFEHFNKVLAEGKLKNPIITIGTRGKKNALGWHLSKGWKHGKEEINELNMCAERVGRPWDEICETLIHEMGHLWNNQHGIVDCSPQGYHNTKFKKVAEQFGLTVEKMKNRGFAKTDLSEKAKQAIASLGVKISDVPKIHRQERAGKKALNSFILCTHEDKDRFQDLRGEVAQVVFVKQLLDLYEEQ